jgi:hypothetical protein
LRRGISRFWYNLACSERSLGRLAEAEPACDRASAIDAGHYASYLLRSELKVQTDSANHIEELETLLSRRPVEYRTRMFVGYALGKELDDLERPLPRVCEFILTRAGKLGSDDLV